MKITIKCTNMERACCPKCGSRNVLAVKTPSCHCGQCGAELEVEISDKVKVQNEGSEYAQMSLF